jgi:uncharacterized membrane protein YkvI
MEPVSSLVSGLKVSFLIIGTTIGAGYASGREMWEFFSSYGSGSHVAILLSILLFSLCCYYIMNISHKLQAPHYVQVLEALMGPTLAKSYDILIFFYLFSTTVVMFAGSGVTLAYWDLSYWLGVGLIACLVFLIFLRDVDGIIALNSFLIPILLCVLIGVCTFFLWQWNGQGQLPSSGLKAYPSGIAFAALNILPLVAILSAIGSKLQKAAMKVASINTFICLVSISLLYNHALLRVGDDIVLYEVPLYAILSSFPSEFIIAVSVILWMAIYTTAVSNVLGIVSRFRERVSHQWKIALGCILLVIPLTQFGFGNLIQFLYPLYGVLNLFVLMTILLYPLAHSREIM